VKRKVDYEVHMIDTRTHRAPQQAAASLGERLRELRTTRGLTQTDLAGDRFSKEYVSQIERGKTRPTPETIAWLAARLGVDAGFLEHGVSADDRGRVEASLTRGEALAQAGDHPGAIEEFAHARAALSALGAVELEVRALAGEAWARAEVGEVRMAIELLGRARGLAEAPGFSDVERADLLFRLGVCRYKLSSISTAIALFGEALSLAERSGLPCDLLRSKIYGWRSRCYRRQRDWQAAREDVEHALQLAEAMDDPRAVADAHFLASVVAEREGHWVLARAYAERAKAYYEELADRGRVGRLLNNLGGLNFLLGKPDEAKALLKQAFGVALEVGSEADAAQAVSSLAQVHLRTEEIDLAEQQARHALELLDGRIDFLDEIGNAQLVLGRALLAQGRLDEAAAALADADESFAQMSSASHQAAVWVAMGDLAVRRGDDSEASKLYRRAAESLQDFRF
jgi:tetratricopeptide (TPR) repeat protein